MMKLGRGEASMIDDFGPYAHEVREYDVKFDSDKAPVIYSSLYASNSDQCVIPVYNGTAFGAKFVIANAYRRDVIVSGEDAVTFGADNAVDQKLFIYGRNIFQEDEQTIKVEDKQSIMKRDAIGLDVVSNWIQSSTMAQSLADWVVASWAGGVHEFILKSFGNPLIQIGDRVTVNYPARNILPDHSYVVIAKTNTFDAGYESQFTIRRLRT
jgi:hypothetical protein